MADIVQAANAIPQGPTVVNRSVFVTALTITGLGAYNAATTGGNVGRTLLGGYVFCLVLGVLDLIPGFSPVVSALAWIALVTMLFTSKIFGDILARVGVQGAGGTSGGSGGGQKQQ